MQQPRIAPDTASSRKALSTPSLSSTPDSTGSGKDKPSAPDRSRKACIVCRSRKMGCGGERPVCKTCLTWGRQCSYSTEQGKTPGARSAAVLSAYLADLEEKLQSMLSSRSRKSTPEGKAPSSRGSSTSSRGRVGDSFERIVRHAKPPATPVEIDLPPADRDKILDMYFRYQHRIGGMVDQAQFFQSLDIEDPNLRPHPALVDVMLLAGMMVAKLSMNAHLLPPILPDTTLLLSQIHRRLGMAIEKSDRLLDHLQASLLLCGWYGYHGRLQEAQFLAASAFSLAVDLQLHRISSEVVKETLNSGAPFSFWDGTILGRPLSRYQLFLRIATFWHAYVCERMMGLVTGLPVACDGIMITTLWLRPLDELVPEDIRATPSPHSIPELLAGEIEVPAQDGNFVMIHQLKTMVLLGSATQLTNITKLLGPDDLTHVEEVIYKIVSVERAVQIFDSTLSHIDGYLPPYQSLDSNTDARRWCMALQTRLGLCAVQEHLLRSVEAALNLLRDCADRETGFVTGINPQIQAALVALVPNDGRSFLSARFDLARRGIKVTHDVAREHIADDPEGFQSDKWLTHLPYVCGYILPSVLTAVLEFIQDVEARRTPNLDQESDAFKNLSIILEDAEQTFEQGMELLSLLSRHMSVLKFQMEKIVDARFPK